MTQLTPREIVRELDRYIIGQDEAKRAVAVALRNRYRRAQLPEDIREEVTPKNILMIGPTGVGKTEIARRLAKLVDAPFVKVEATKFTEVGYVGRDARIHHPRPDRGVDPPGQGTALPARARAGGGQRRKPAGRAADPRAEEKAHQPHRHPAGQPGERAGAQPRGSRQARRPAGRRAHAPAPRRDGKRDGRGRGRGGDAPRGHPRHGHEHERRAGAASCRRR